MFWALQVFIHADPFQYRLLHIKSFSVTVMNLHPWLFFFLYLSVNVYTFIKTSEATVLDEIPHQQDFPVKHH